MNRKEIIELLQSTGYPVYNIDQKYTNFDEPYIVLRAAYRAQSTRNSRGYRQTWEVLCYVPDTSMVRLDAMVETVMTMLKTERHRLYITGVMGPDFHDEDTNTYMRYISFDTLATLCTTWEVEA